MSSYVLQRTDNNQYEANVDRDGTLSINWCDDINDAFVWDDLTLAQDQASDYDVLGFPTAVVEVEVEEMI